MPDPVALPRLVVRPAREDSSVPSSIIIGYDGRETSDDAAALGARLAETVSGIQLMSWLGLAATGPRSHLHRTTPRPSCSAG